MPLSDSLSMDHQINISIAGLGIIFYSPFAVTHIADGTDYLETDFWEPAHVAGHVMKCKLSAFATGSPGDFKIRLFDGQYSDTEIDDAMAVIRIGIEIQDHPEFSNQLECSFQNE